MNEDVDKKKISTSYASYEEKCGTCKFIIFEKKYLEYTCVVYSPQETTVTTKEGICHKYEYRHKSIRGGAKKKDKESCYLSTYQVKLRGYFDDDW